MAGLLIGERFFRRLFRQRLLAVAAKSTDRDLYRSLDR
jgi:hypothetical protein